MELIPLNGENGIEVPTDAVYVIALNELDLGTITVAIGLGIEKAVARLAPSVMGIGAANSIMALGKVFGDLNQILDQAVPCFCGQH